MQNKTYKARASAGRALLVDKFPACFKARGEPKRLLKIGISKDIKARYPEMSNRAIASAVGDYVRGPTYLRNFVEGAVRIDLDGNEAGLVTAEQVAFASAKLAKILVAMKPKSKKNRIKRRVYLNDADHKEAPARNRAARPRRGPPVQKAPDGRPADRRDAAGPAGAGEVDSQPPQPVRRPRILSVTPGAGR
ncbi:MAG: ProQ/FinO family protein [Elusimicrobia bacterium]|nr:ProQ/FinO family protein [Elusimicrobiota bacterium]